MADATVTDTYCFPVKGARGTRCDRLQIDPRVGVVGDRRIGIKRRADQSDAWAPKGYFRVCVNTPEMAAQTPVFAGDASAPRAGLDPLWLADVAAKIGQPEVALLDTKGDFNLVDTNPFEHGPTVSFLNLASVRALEAETGWDIDPERFRMNVLYDDGEPFSELAWADSFPGRREFTVGALRFRVQDACERCLAIEANPQTGRRDLPLLAAIKDLLTARGYAGSPHRGSFHVMGFLATPLGADTLSPGQRVRLA